MSFFSLLTNVKSFFLLPFVLITLLKQSVSQKYEKVLTPLFGSGRLLFGSANFKLSFKQQNLEVHVVSFFENLSLGKKNRSHVRCYFLSSYCYVFLFFWQTLLLLSWHPKWWLFWFWWKPVKNPCFACGNAIERITIAWHKRDAEKIYKRLHRGYGRYNRKPQKTNTQKMHECTRKYT